MRTAAAALLLALCAGCRDPAPAPGPTAWGVLELAFGERFFDAPARNALLSAPAAQALILPGLLDATGYRFLQVAELRRVDADTRLAEVAFSVDGWPMALHARVVRGPDGWRVAEVDPPERQRARLALLGPHGLPVARSARPWRGGLAGRDAVGRPTAAVLLLAQGPRVEVDGVEVPENTAEAVGAAVRSALEARQALARAAHATYRPQVAIALGREEPAPRLPTLARWAADAGAEALLLVVRGARDQPALLPLARTQVLPPGVEPPPVARIHEYASGVHVEWGALRWRVARGREDVDRAELAAALEAVQAAAPDLAGAVVEVPIESEHGHTVALLDALRAAAPTLAFAPVLPAADSP